MDKRSEAAALAGWSENPNAPVNQRLAAAKKSLDFYIDQADKLDELLTYARGMSDGNESGDAREAYDDVADKLRAILDGE